LHSVNVGLFQKSYKIGFTASLLYAQHEANNVENKTANSLGVFLGKELNGCMVSG